MKICKKSWHYRLNTFLNDSYRVKEKNTLCSYFWCTIFSLLKALAMLVAILFAVWIPGQHMVSEDFVEGSLYHILASFGAGMVFWAVLIAMFILLTCLVEEFREWINRRRMERESIIVEPKKPSLFIEFLKAKKRKICPLLEFKD